MMMRSLYFIFKSKTYNNLLTLSYHINKVRLITFKGKKNVIIA